MGTVDEYLADLNPADAEAVGRVYDFARAVTPGTDQGTSYGMPALLYRGHPLVSVMATARHIGIYPFSAEAVAGVAQELAAVPGTSHAKGTIRFDRDHPLPGDLIRSLVSARRDQIDAMDVR